MLYSDQILHSVQNDFYKRLLRMTLLRQVSSREREIIRRIYATKHKQEFSRSPNQRAKGANEKCRK